MIKRRGAAHAPLAPAHCDSASAATQKSKPVTGQRTMPDEWYDQLVDLLKRVGLKKVKSDMDDLEKMFAAQNRVR